MEGLKRISIVDKVKQYFINVTHVRCIVNSCTYKLSSRAKYMMSPCGGVKATNPTGEWILMYKNKTFATIVKTKSLIR